jgi:hypothetical protein
MHAQDTQMVKLQTCMLETKDKASDKHIGDTKFLVLFLIPSGQIPVF